jgi:antitoxin ParD1/3/4
MIDFEENFPMNVSLTRELDKFVAAKVASGRYTSASEVVREALRLLEEQDSARERQLAAFNRELAARLQSLDRGNYVEPDVVWAELERKSRARRKKRA